MDSQKRQAFMWEVVKFLEGRILMVDTKANMLIAIEAGLFLVISWVAKEYFLTDYPKIVKWYLVLYGASMGAVILLLLWIIRPTKQFLGKRIELDGNQHGNKLIWPGRAPKHEDFKTIYDGLSEEDIVTELQSMIWVRQQLVRRKYNLHEQAHRLAKVQMLCTFAVFVVALIFSH